MSKCLRKRLCGKSTLFADDGVGELARESAGVGSKEEMPDCFEDGSRDTFSDDSGLKRTNMAMMISR